MHHEPLDALVAAGRDGGPSSRGAFSARILAGPTRNRIELARHTGAPVAVLEGRWLRTVSTTFSAGERWFAASGYAGGVMVWNADNGALAACFPTLAAEDAGAERMPLLFVRGDSLLACGGRYLTFIDTDTWTVTRELPQPVAAMRAGPDPLRIVLFEPCDGAFTRWTLNLKSFEIEGADRLRDTRLYRGLVGDRKAS